MSTFVNNDVNDGDVIEASDHNTQGSLIAAVLNGGIENDNISASAGIAGTKLSDGSVTSEKLDATIISRAYLSGAQSINSGAPRKVLLDAESYDLGSDFDTGNSRFVAPNTGYYLVSATVGISNIDAAGNILDVYIYVNGSAYKKVRGIAGSASGSGNDPLVSVTDVVPATAGQYIELYAEHDSATASEALQTGATITTMTVMYVGA